MDDEVVVSPASGQQQCEAGQYRRDHASPDGAGVMIHASSLIRCRVYVGQSECSVPPLRCLAGCVTSAAPSEDGRSQGSAE